MSYKALYNGSCDCPGDKIVPLTAQCVGCGNNGQDSAVSQEINQRRQWGLVRTSSSMFTMNLSALTVRGGPSNTPRQMFGGVNWNQSSDRAIPSHRPETMNVSRNRTRHRPGASGTGGDRTNGLDIKHNSYARYLARRKAKNLKSIVNDPLPPPQYGNKQYSLGLISGCKCKGNP